MYFRNYGLRKNAVRSMSKKSLFRGSFESNMVNAPKHC